MRVADKLLVALDQYTRCHRILVHWKYSHNYSSASIPVSNKNREKNSKAYRCAVLAAQETRSKST